VVQDPVQLRKLDKMIIAFMGNDGSGKSTTVSLICHRLKDSKLEFKIVPGFEHLVIQHLKKLVGFLMGNNGLTDLQKTYSDGKLSGPKKKRVTLLFMIWPLFVFIDCIMLLVKSCAQSDKIIIFDRYFYDYTISFKELGYSSMLVDKIFLFFPKPDVGFIFDVKPEIAYSRKKHDHSAPLDQYFRQRKRYLRLAREKGLPVINTSSLSPEDASEKVLESMFRHPKFKSINVTD
jgi:thymidylate kinase